MVGSLCNVTSSKWVTSQYGIAVRHISGRPSVRTQARPISAVSTTRGQNGGEKGATQERVHKITTSREQSADEMWRCIRMFGNVVEAQCKVHTSL